MKKPNKIREARLNKKRFTTMLNVIRGFGAESNGLCIFMKSLNIMDLALDSKK